MKYIDELAKVASKAKAQGKQMLAHKERFEKGVDKEKLKQELADLMAGKERTLAGRDMVYVARELQNADTLMEQTQEKMLECQEKYELNVRLLHAMILDSGVDLSDAIDLDEYFCPTVVLPDIEGSAEGTETVPCGAEVMAEPAGLREGETLDEYGRRKFQELSEQHAEGVVEDQSADEAAHEADEAEVVIDEASIDEEPKKRGRRRKSSAA